jgi:hypothetical protein
MTKNEKAARRCNAPKTWARILAALAAIVERERGRDGNT